MEILAKIVIHVRAERYMQLVAFDIRPRLGSGPFGAGCKAKVIPPNRQDPLADGVRPNGYRRSRVRVAKLELVLAGS